MAPAVELLANLSGELAARIRAEAQGWDGTIELVGLYGSAARRDGDSASDIDVLVVSDAANLDEFVDHLAGRIRAWTGNSAQIVALGRAGLRRLRRAKEPITAAWDRELVVVCGERRTLQGR